jgi:putative oxidoreductase
MLVLGWKARWAAIALALFTLVSMFIFHAYWSVPRRPGAEPADPLS